MRFTINLATKTYINQKKLTLVLSACIIVLSFFLFVNLKIFTFNHAEISRLSNIEASLAAKQGTRGRTVPEKDYVKLLSSIKLANGIIERKAYSWIDLLDRLESVVPEGVSLTAVEPGVKEKTLNLSGAALHFKNLRLFMENLEASKFFYDVYLLKQDELKTAENQKGIAFTITCRFAL
jgi:type IV pilus assembly protein PilN